MSTQMPKWRKPKEHSEADSLILDMLLFLEKYGEHSTERELALRKVFLSATYYLSVTNVQREDLLSILWAYGAESVRPVIQEVSEHSSPEVIDTACTFVKTYKQPRALTCKDTLEYLKSHYTNIVKLTREQTTGVGRSVLAWQDHKLYYFHPGGLMYEVEIKDRYTTTVHKGIVETIIHLTEEEERGLRINGPLPSYKPSKKHRPWYDNDLVLWLIFVSLIFGMCGVIIYFLK
jgi:hypothetical protein